MGLCLPLLFLLFISLYLESEEINRFIRPYPCLSLSYLYLLFYCIYPIYIREQKPAPVSALYDYTIPLRIKISFRIYMDWRCKDIHRYGDICKFRLCYRHEPWVSYG